MMMELVSMFCSKHIAIALFTLTLIVPGTSYAQTSEDNTTAPTIDLRTSRALFPVSWDKGSIRQSLAAADLNNELYSNRTTTSVRQAPAPARSRSVGRKILGGVLGGVGGFFAGGYLGAAIEGDRCECDDPGLVGSLIGAPVGATVGAILGYKFF